jgi:type I restriction enzyme R subunit
MPNAEGKGYVDYVLWGDDGKPLGLVEAKRTKKDPKVGLQQAKLYADCLEKQCGRRPVIFCSNGYDHWIWDDATYPPRPVQGFYKKTELELVIQRRTSKKALAAVPVSKEIVERHYQVRAIRRIGETFEKEKQRKALVVMATGAGKTRTVIALADLLMRCNWAKRVLFLADRVALVNQAVNAFKKHLPDSSPVNLVTQKDGHGRVYVSTYPTMMGLIDDTKEGERRFGVGHFDLVVIDEAHRSVFQKYRAIFEYFDSLLVGLTATPKDEVDRNTYSLFELETGIPTDAYALEEAVKDKFLVPPKGVSVPLKFVREGIKYADLSEQEKDEWDALEWDEEQGPPDAVDPVALNQWLFNKDTVDKVLEHLMTHGVKVAGGDRLGKTIVFAKNNVHAEFIAERFDANYPHLKGVFARVVTYKTVYAQTLIDDFSQKEKAPHIAISVDMLDTGIDVPEVVNLVFFKMIRSKTKFWQMVGRGTRLCPDLFGPDQHKQFFFIFDYCQNLEFFSQDLPAAEGTLAASLGTRLFRSRVALVTEDLLAEKPNIPMVAAQMELIQEVQGEPWWEDVTVGLLEVVRKRLRGLMGLIDKVERKPIYTDFEDELGAAAEVDLPDVSGGDSFERFRIKARLFLNEHKDHIAIAKLRRNEPLTKTDLKELERMLTASGAGRAEDIKRAAEEAAGLGLFVRSLVGLDREAAKRALGRFLDDTRFNANQIEFASLMVDQLTERGVMDAALLYESPFTDVAPTGPDGLYKSAEVEDLVAILETVKVRAGAVA